MTLFHRLSSSTRQNIRDGHPDFIVTADSWPAFLYPHGKASQEDVEHGLFQSAILVKVCGSLSILSFIFQNPQAFKFIFTSPTSAMDINSENDIENQALRPLKRAKSNKAPTRGNVASLLGMRSVTPRSIAYVAVQASAFKIYEISIDLEPVICASVTICSIKCCCME
jgi:hypothetical protein